MQIYIAINKLRGLITFFENYRENGFTSTLELSNEIVISMEIEPIFCEKCIVRRKKQFDEVMNDKKIQSVEEYFRIDYFLFIIDHAISSFHSRFEQFTKYENIFVFLYNLKKLKSQNDDSLKEYCVSLENFLKHNMFFNIDCLDLFSEKKLYQMKQIHHLKY